MKTEPKTRPFAMRLTPEVRKRLEDRAEAEGVAPATLATEWVRERLTTPPLRELLARALVVVIAALSTDVDEAKAKDIVTEFFLEATKS